MEPGRSGEEVRGANAMVWAGFRETADGGFGGRVGEGERARLQSDEPRSDQGAEKL